MNERIYMCNCYLISEGDRKEKSCVCVCVCACMGAHAWVRVWMLVHVYMCIVCDMLAFLLIRRLNEQQEDENGGQCGDVTLTSDPDS